MEISPEQKCLAVSSITANKCTSTCTEFYSKVVQVGLSFSITSGVAVQCDLPRREKKQNHILPESRSNQKSQYSSL